MKTKKTTKEKLARIQILMPKEQKEFLRKEAFKKKRTLSSLIYQPCKDLYFKGK